MNLKCTVQTGRTSVQNIQRVQLFSTLSGRIESVWGLTLIEDCTDKHAYLSSAHLHYWDLIDRMEWKKRLYKYSDRGPCSNICPCETLSLVLTLKCIFSTTKVCLSNMKKLRLIKRQLRLKSCWEQMKWNI